MAPEGNKCIIIIIITKRVACTTVAVQMHREMLHINTSEIIMTEISDKYYFKVKLSFKSKKRKSPGNK